MLRSRLLPWLILTAAAPSQQPEQQLAAAAWRSREVAVGVTASRCHFAALFGSPQHVCILRVDLRTDGIRVALADAEPGRQPTSVLARHAGAAAAVNGGFFAPDGQPDGLFQIGGTVLRPGDGRRPAALGIELSGRLRLADTPHGGWPEVSDALAAGPWLVRDGKVQPAAGGPRHPRTALGTADEARTLLLATVDGRTEQAAGMTMAELAELMQQLGCEQAINLDGGGSSTMWALGAGGIVNRPCDNESFDQEGERAVANAVLIHGRLIAAFDDELAECVPTDGWAELDSRPAEVDGDALAAPEGARATWRIEAPRPGRYAVEIRVPADSPAVQAEFAGSSHGIDGDGRWHRLGELSAATTASSVHVTAAGRFLVDAVRLVELDDRR